MPANPKQLGREPRLPDRIAALLKEDISQGQLKAGERLPTEQTLSQTYGVSRNVIREGIARLRNEGIITSQQGIGAFVTKKPVPVLRLDDGLEQADRHRHLFELRLTLEVRAAEIAATRHTADDLAEMQRAFDDMKATKDWANGGVEHDLSFHRAVAGATGNTFMLETTMFIAEHLKESIQLTRSANQLTETETHAVTLQEHWLILDAIKAGLPVAARAAMTTHMINAAARIGLHDLDDMASP